MRIANCLVLFVNGSQNYFNHRTNVDSANRIICFDIKELGSQLKELGMLIVQDAVWNRVSMNRERRVATRYYCDEFHVLLRERQTALYSIEIWKRFRKWGGIPTGLTQNVSDFLMSPDVEGILGNSDFIYLLNQSAPDQRILADKLELSDKQLEYVTSAEPGSGVIKFDNVVIPFVDRYPTDTKTYAIMNTRPEALDEPSPDDMEEKRSPALAYGVLVLLFGAAAGGIYFFRTYRKEGEDFIDEDDEEDEEEIYVNEDMENEESFDNADGDEGIAEDDDFFYGEDE